ncbi:FG-GAP repeat protein [Leptospira johnsonii]|uniref:FG-GAP repeat protein n=1 Tax=Leptospira johnsonii TaxID=1917820 RepID=A0A2P2D762_9LEPT|nr:FG-GAP repeat protein [Leptospira johnsonii]GBF40483.1 FG-GAP repeat protein [Leptospira johnsonii]
MKTKLTMILLICLNSFCSGTNSGLSALAAFFGLPQTPSYGNVQFAVNVSSSLAKVTVTVTGTGISTPIVQDLVKVGNTWQGIIGQIPAGTDRTFSGEGYNASNVLIQQGQVTGVTIIANSITNIVLVLSETDPSPPFSNAAPIIDSLVASTNRVAPSSSINLNSTAHDPNPSDTLTYLWSSTGGSFNNSNILNPVWTSPSTPGQYTITLTVSDPLGASASLSFTADVQLGYGTGYGSINVGSNSSPFVTNIISDPSSIAPGASTNISLTAFDPDGNTISYSWSSSCAGSFDDANAQNPVFTASSSASLGPCTLSVSLSDGNGGSNLGYFTIQISQTQTVNLAPQILSSFQTGLALDPSGTMVFRVTATDPENTPVSFAWNSSSGTVGTPTNTINGNLTTSEIVWTAPTCGSNLQVSVTVTDGDGNSVNLNYLPVNINGAPNCAFTAWAQQAFLKASNTNAGDNFGRAWALSGDTIVIGAPLEDSNQNTITNGSTSSSDNSTSGSGAVYVFKRSGNTWEQQAYIKAPNAEEGDLFGFSVSISGDTIAVGAIQEGSNQSTITNGTSASSDNSLTFAGAVYVFARNGNIWSQQAYIKPSNPSAYDAFGYSLAIQGDTLVVGSKNESGSQNIISNGQPAPNDDTLFQSGAAYVFKRTGTNWVEEAYIKPSNPDANDSFGYSVAISGDKIAVSSYYESSNQNYITNGSGASSDNSLTRAGAVYIFSRSVNIWTQEAYIKPSNPDEDDQFGVSVSLYGDTLAVGASGEDSNQNNISSGTTASSDNSSQSSGAVYVFVRSGSGWSQQAYLKASNSDPSDYFGAAISLYGDTIAVGALDSSAQTFISYGNTASSDNSAQYAGAVYIFERNGASWSQTAYIKAPNANAYDFFGGVCLDGNNLLVSAYLESSSDNTVTNGTYGSSDNSMQSAGAAYIFVR